MFGKDALKKKSYRDWKLFKKKRIINQIGKIALPEAESDM